MSLQKIVFLILLFINGNSIRAQQPGVFEYYYNSDNKLSEKSNASFVLIVYKENPGDQLWKRDYFTKVDHKKLSIGYCKDSLGLIQQGACKYFDYKGNLDETGYFENDKKNGEWIAYFTSGKKRRVFNYSNGKKSGLNLEWYENGNIRDSFDLDKNGNGHGLGLYEDGQKKYEGMFADGRKKGEWKYYYDMPGNKQSMTATFEKDSLLSSGCFDREGKVQKDCAYEKEARFVGGHPEWVQYLIKTITKSKYTKYMKRGEQYTTVVKFVVDGEGNVTDAAVEVPNVEKLDRIAENIIAKSPRWEPAIQYNQPVRAYRRQPITFVVYDE